MVWNDNKNPLYLSLSFSKDTQHLATATVFPQAIALLNDS